METVAEVFTRRNFGHVHPMEDVCSLSPDGRSFAVADGVTRDNYLADDAGPSGATQAAEILCESILSSIDVHVCDGRGLRLGFDRANEQIGKLNQQCGKGIDYRTNDYFGAVAAAAYICDSEHLHFGYVGDCRVFLMSATGERKLETPDDVAPVRSYLAYLKSSGVESQTERSVLIRSRVRNNSLFQDDLGNRPGYGVLTGEAGVKDFYRFGRVDLANGDLIAVFTDGLAPVVEREEFRQLTDAYPWDLDGRELQRRLADLCDHLAMTDLGIYGDDKALVLVRCK